VDYTRVLLGTSLPLNRSLWECDSCGHRWPESNEKPPADFLISASSILLIVIALQTFAGVLFSVIAVVGFVALRWWLWQSSPSVKSLIGENLINMRIGNPPTQMREAK
jgi:hypothetical protein